MMQYVDSEGGTHIKFICTAGEISEWVFSKLANNPEHTLLEIEAIRFFREKGKEVTGVEKTLEEVRRIIDITTRDQKGIEVLIECKHGNELTFDKDRRGQIEDYFAYSKQHEGKVRLYIGGDITGPGARICTACHRTTRGNRGTTRDLCKEGA